MGVPIFVEFVAGLGGFMSGLAGAEAGITRLARSGEGSMASLSKAAPIMGAAVLAAGVAVAGEAVKMAGDFQQSMTKLATTAGESQSNLKMVGDGILTMAGQVGIAANDLAKGMYTVESAGFHGADALNVLKASAEGAKQENADLSKVTDAVSTALRDYHLPASDAAKVTSQLITAVSHGKTTFDELTGALHSVTPIASAAGISLADVTSTLASMTASGATADQAAQNLGATMPRLAAMTQPMIKELGALGLNAADLSKNLGKTGVAGTMQEISQAIMQKMGPAGTTLLSTMNQSTQAGVDAKKMFDSLPPALQQVAEKYKSGALDLTKYKSEIKGVPGDQRMLINSWKTMTDRADGFSQALKSGSNDSQTYLSALKQATGGQEGLAVALQVTGENAASTNASYKDVAGSAAQADGNIRGWDEVQGNFNQKMSELHATVGALMIRLGDVLLPTVTKVAGAFLSFTTFIETHKSAMIALAAVIGGVMVVALAAVSVAMYGFLFAEDAVLMNPLTWAIVAIVAAAVLLGVVIYELWTHWSQIWGWITGRVAAANDQILGAWNAVKDWTVSIWHAITGYLVGAWNDMTHAVMTGVKMVTDPLVAAWHWVESITSTVWNGITDFFKKWWPLLLGIFAPEVFAVLAIWNHFHQQITDTVLGVWNWVTGFLTGIWNGITDFAQASWQRLHDWIVQPVEAAANWVMGRLGELANWLAGLWNSVADTTRNLWDSIVNVVSNSVNAQLGVIQRVGGDIAHAIWAPIQDGLNFVEGLVGDAENIGWNIIMGMIHGVEHAASHLVDAVGGVLTSALGGATSLLNINSPSLLFSQEVGSPISEGIAHGIQASGHLVDKALGVVTKPFTPGESSFGLSGGAGGSHGGGQGTTINVNINGTFYGMGGKEQAARDIRDELLRMQMRSPLGFAAT